MEIPKGTQRPAGGGGEGSKGGSGAVSGPGSRTGTGERISEKPAWHSPGTGKETCRHDLQDAYAQPPHRVRKNTRCSTGTPGTWPQETGNNRPGTPGVPHAR